ncbi:MAG: NADPH-dependent glutamate synthase [Deltaproteobacteria bacterium]|nr:NADPH-dependent glutamate synthase [Deltaproteobacteria bacterium]
MAKKIIVPKRTSMSMQAPEVRRDNFNEVALGYTLAEAQTEARRCLQCKKPTCQAGCPVEVDCRGFIREVAEGRLDEAFRAIKATNSLPAVCGRVCPQENQCEGACTLGRKYEPVAIGRLERFVADSHYASSACQSLTGGDECPLPQEDLRVAAVGSGPASLTFAGYLATRGIPVTVFEAMHEVGGVLVYGIPEFRLPKSIVALEVEQLEAQGVSFETNAVVGRTVGVQELLNQGFKAVFVGVGAGLPRFLGVPGENLIGVYSANEYLTRVNLMKGYRFPEYDTPVTRGRRVAVFGGGNVAMDSARTALRLGADKVFIVYRRTRDEMPARLEELEHAVEERVELVCLCGPLEFSGDDQGRLTGVRLQKMCLGEPDESGRCRPVCLEGQTESLEIDMAVIAVGTGSNPVLTRNTPGLELNRRGYIVADPETGETSLPNVFAGGDIVTGSATVVMAMGAGRRAAKVVAARLLGATEVPIRE